MHILFEKVKTSVFEILVYLPFGGISLLKLCDLIMWASSRENLSLGYQRKRVSNQYRQLQRLARRMKFPL